MGYMRHHVIIVTSFEEKLICKAQSKALELFGSHVSGVIESPVNFYFSFFVAPDGSKEGWNESTAGDEARESFVAWLNRRNCLDWVEVQYGDDEHETVIVSDSDSKYRHAH